ncbi:hypothetical protein GZH46_02949, partial [Fragariocoptes setiger]
SQIKPEESKAFLAGKSKFIKRSKTNKKDIVCNYCKKNGHIAKECRKLKKKEEEKGQSEEKSTDKSVSFMAIEEQHLVDDHWIADSGCTSHMTPKLEWIENYVEFSKRLPIQLGDDRTIYAEGSGSISTAMGHLATNLFSINAITKKGLEARYTRNAIIILRGDTEILRGDKKNGVHFGHVSMVTLKNMADSGAVQDMQIIHVNETNSKCEDCAFSKCHRSSHPSRSTLKAAKPGESLHFDTVGPIQPESLGGARFILLCKDEYSSYRHVKFVVPNKFKIPDEVKKIISKTELQTGNKTLRMVSDNGTEFVNESLKKFLDARGILHETSAPYCPQQNGLIERHTNCDKLCKSTPNNFLWAEAVNTAVFLLNRTTNKRNNQQTPYELGHGHKPSAKYLREFGQKAAVLKPDSQIKGKFDTKSTQAAFVGYTDLVNTFRFYIPEQRQVVVSCDVIFLDGLAIETELPMSRNEITILDDVADEDHLSFENPNDPPAPPPSPEPSSSSVKEDTTPSVDTQDCETSVSSTPVRSKINRDCPPPVPQHKHKPYIAAQVDTKNVLRTRLRSESISRANVALQDIAEDPTSWRDAMQSENSEAWKQAASDEMKSMQNNHVWTLVDKPPGRDVIKCRWVFKTKKSPRDWSKGLAGSTQKPGIDYTDTYAPVADMVSLRLILAMAETFKLIVGQFEVKTAFLNRSLDEELYVSQPEGFDDGTNRVCRLNKSIYGLKQSPRQWNLRFTDVIKSLGLATSENDGCVFISNEPLIIVVIYVDDGLVLAKSSGEVDTIINKLNAEFEIERVALSTYLGFQIEQSPNGDISIHQSGYISRMLKKYNIQDCHPVPTPVSVGESNDTPLDGSVPYREAVGSLLYAATITRPDIAFAVGKQSLVKRVLRYLKGTTAYGIRYSATEARELIAYCDADFAESRRSTTGSLIMTAGGPV